ncbi:MAG: hypothetical protein K0Q43_92 [Ramlibacter sp.]|nr:hypothetical protein [Ramlibacter sp.]
MLRLLFNETVDPISSMNHAREIPSLAELVVAIARRVGARRLSRSASALGDAELFGLWAGQFQAEVRAAARKGEDDIGGLEPALDQFVQEQAREAGFRAVDPWLPISLPALKAHGQGDDSRLWLFHRSAGVMLGKYEWRQGWDPDRLLCDGGDYHALDEQFTHYLPYSQPQPPAEEPEEEPVADRPGQPRS